MGQDSSNINHEKNHFTDTILPVKKIADTFYSASEKDVLHFPYNKKRVRLIAVTNVTAYGTLMAGLYASWYKNYPQTMLHSFNDIKECMEIDKVGHV